MDIYWIALALGGLGLGVMALGGIGHQGHHGHTGHHTDFGIGARGARGPAHHAHTGTHGSARGIRGAGNSALLWTLSTPRVLFSVSLGFGAAGLLLHGALSGAALFVAALLIGIAFERLAVRPLMNALLGFASTPARTLASTILDEARAASGFDANGEGLIAVDVDGQIVQVLGMLRPEDRALGVRVRAGDVLRIEDVDEARNRCTVSFLGRP